MSTINLEKLLSQRDVLPVVNALITFIKTPLAVWDVHSHCILGTADDAYEKQHPITLEGDVIGGVSGDEGAAILASFLSFAAIKEHEKKALTRETLGKYRDLVHLYEISEKLSTSFASAEIAQLAISETLSLFHATNASIMLTGDEQGLFQVIAASGTKNAQTTILHSDQGIAGRVLQTGNAEVVNDVSSDPEFVKGGNNISSLMCAPLRTKNAVMGVFNVSSEEPHTYSSEDLKLLSSIATQVGSAITNALLYEELNNNSKELRQKNIQLQSEITERIRSANALKESEEKYRLHFDNAMDVIYSVNSNFVITQISPSIEKFLGYTMAEVTLKPFTELNMLTSESLAKAYSDAKRVLSGERVDSAEYEFIAKDGSIKIGEVSSAPLFEEGKVIALISVARDVTDRKKAQGELAESEERFRTMAENIMDGLVIAERGEIVFVNKKVEEITGYSADEIISRRKGIDFVVPEQRAQMEHIQKEALKTGVYPQHMEVWITRKDGKRRCISKQFSLNRQGDTIEAGYEIITDITERKRAEDQLRETSHFLNNVIENSVDSILITDYSGFVKRVNRAFLDLLGYTQEEVIGKHATEFTAFSSGTYTAVTGEEITLIEEEQYSDAQKKIYNLFYKEGKISNWEFYLVRKDGMIVPVEQNMIALRNEKGEIIGAVGIARDITERKVAQVALIKSEERFRTMADSITNGLIIMEEGKTVYVNKRASEITGYSQEELMKKWGPDLVVEEDEEWKNEVVSEIQKTGDWPEQIDAWISRKDGSKCCVNLRFSFSSKVPGDIYAGYVLITDITESKLAEKKLRDTTDFLNNIIESSQDSIVISDQVGNLTRVNQYFLEKLGYTQEEVLGKHVSEFVPSGTGRYELITGGEVEILQNYFENQKVMIDALYKDGKVENWEAYYSRKDGKLIPVEQNLFFLHDLKGEKMGSVGIVRDITERKKAETQLQGTTAFLDNVIESSLDSIVVSDNKGKLQRVNRAFLQLLDYEENEVLGKMMSELSVTEEGTYETVYGEKIQIGKAHIDYMMDMVSRFINEGKISNWVSYVFRNDRKIIPVEVSIVNLYDGKGLKTGSVGIVRDVSERRKAEREITKARDFLENIVECSIDPIIIGDEVGMISRTNKSFQELLGYTEDEIQGRHIGEFVPVEPGTYESRAGTMVTLDDKFFQEAEDRMTELVEGGSLAAWQSCYLGKDGKIIPVEQTISFLYDKNGERTGVVGISRDITERVKAEQEILKTRDFLQDIFKTSLEGIVVTDAQSSITMVNDSAVKILGYPRRDLLKRKTQDFLKTGDEMEERGKQIQKVLMKKGSVTGYEHKWTRKNGTIIDVEISVALLKDQKGALSGAVLSIRDITARKKAEQKLVESQEQLRSLASQLTLTEERERRRIATDLHDRIGQALAISKIKLGALRESTAPHGLGNDVDGIRDLIEETIRDTRSLIFDLCPPFLYELGFEKAIEWLLEDIQTQHGVTTHLKSDGKLKSLEDDIRVLLYQSIRELFVNIVKHAQAENAQLTIKSDDNTVSLCVEDDGRGFDENATPFRMEKDGGFGLYRIQERFHYLGGDIKIKSKPDQGTKIYLKLPFTINVHTDKEERK